MTAILPNLDHITLKDESQVYVPSDDTFLLCDALLKEKEYLLEQVNPKIVLEMGVGSGCVITYCTQLLLAHAHTTFQSFGVDINIEALKLTRKTFERNVGSNRLELIQSNLFQAMEFIPQTSLLKGNIDILIFNPPYVPSESSEIGTIPANWSSLYFDGVSR